MKRVQILLAGLLISCLEGVYMPHVKAQESALVVPSEPSTVELVPFTIPPMPLPPLGQPDLPIEELALSLEIRLNQRRVALLKGGTVIKSYPIAVGKAGWETPTGNFKVMQMFKDPTWIHPLKPGIVIKGGDPENPLGRFWIGFWTDGKNWIGFHGTPNPGSVGRAASHGCIRMYNKDIEELFALVNLGTEVKVVK